jgi:hypothetical protein
MGIYSKQLQQRIARRGDFEIGFYKPDLITPESADGSLLYEQIQKNIFNSLPKRGLFGLFRDPKDSKPVDKMFITLFHLPIVNSEMPLSQFNSRFRDSRRKMNSSSGTRDDIFEILCERIVKQNEDEGLRLIHLHLPIPWRTPDIRNVEGGIDTLDTPNWLLVVPFYGYMGYVHAIVRQKDNYYWISGGEEITVYA